MAGTAREGVATADGAAAFDRLLERHLADAYRLAALILGDRSEAEDATHDAAVRAWMAWGSLRDQSRFGPWFQRIVVNVCRNRLRRRRIRPVPLDDPPIEGPDPLADTPERLALRSSLRRLTPDHRTVVVLRYFADLSIDEIADRIGERPGTVRSRLHYALRELRAAYDAADRAPEVRR